MDRASTVRPTFNSEGNDLPEGWVSTTLGEVCQHPQYGWTTSAARRTEGLKLLRTTDISSGVVDWGSVPVCSVEPDDPEKYVLHPGDIVVSRAGSVGLSFIVRECPRAAFASYLIRLRPTPPIQSGYVALFLQSASYWSQVVEESAGIAVPNINATKLSGLSLPLPPLAEQKRIVAKVEGLLARVNAARERMARIPAILKRFRQAVFAAACSGVLTSDWRKSCPGFQRISEEFGSTLAEKEAQLDKFEARKGGRNGRRKGSGRSGPHFIRSDEYSPEELHELPAGWFWARLGFLGEDPLSTVQTGPFGAQLHNDEFTETGVPVVAVGNLTGMGFTREGLYYISPAKAQQLQRYDVREGDVLFARSGATLGKVCAVPSGIDDWRMTGHILRVRFDHAILAPDFAVYALHGDTSVRAQVFGSIRGITRPGFNTDLLASILPPLPSPVEQLEIIRRVEVLLRLAGVVESRIGENSAQVEKLAKAVLARAFRGDLVPTEAELARSESRAYEPASALLARIRSYGP